MKKDFENINNRLLNFKTIKESLTIIQRKKPLEAEKFFQKVIKTLTHVNNFVTLNNAKKDIKKILNKHLTDEIKNDSFYQIWINDMGSVCQAFCEFLKEDTISFWLGTKRGCKQFHVDMVPFRLLVTYAGQGTQVLPNFAADREAFFARKSYDEIIKDKKSLKCIKKWDIAIFRGGRNGVIHRTPESALLSKTSLLMRLDTSSFLKDIKRINNVA